MSPRARTAIIGACSVGIFVASWLFRFNDPGGSFAGLTDDHFFYVVRGWQILFGDLPVRDFVDHGAPLYYYVSAAVQEIFGRGTVSELAFSTTVLSLGAVLTFWLATAASGSIWAGLAACLLHVWLGPRFYNYPKVLVYAVAIPLLWRFADRPGTWLRAWIAVLTVIAFLFRHDHGAFVGLATVVLMLSLTELRIVDRVRHAVIYGLLVAALVAPYFIFIQANGGLVSYFRQASAWAERDRAREPIVWPGLTDNPDGVSDAAKAGSVVAAVRDNGDAWMYYLEILLPFLALLVLAVSRDGFRPEWPHARAKLAMVAVLALALDAGFLRSPLEARLADPSVPIVILIAWLLVAALRLVRGDESLVPALRPYRWPLRAVTSGRCRSRRAAADRAGERRSLPAARQGVDDRAIRQGVRAGRRTSPANSSSNGTSEPGSTRREPAGAHHAVALHQRLHRADRSRARPVLSAASPGARPPRVRGRPRRPAAGLLRDRGCAAADAGAAARANRCRSSCSIRRTRSAASTDRSRSSRPISIRSIVRPARTRSTGDSASRCTCARTACRPARGSHWAGPVTEPAPTWHTPG